MDDKITFNFLKKYFHFEAQTFHTQSAGLLNGKHSIKEGAIIVKKPASDDDVWAHINGKKQIGISPLLRKKVDNSIEANYYCQWCCIDYDPPKSLSIMEAADRVMDFVQHIKANHVDLHPCVERSRNKGFHIWFFFDSLVLAEDCRIFLYFLVNSFGMKDCEIFPKQVARNLVPGAEGYYGSSLNLPLCGIFTKNKKTVFLTLKKNEQQKTSFVIAPQDKYLEQLSETKSQVVSKIVSRIDRNTMPAHIETGFETKSSAAMYNTFSSEYAKSNCYLLRQCAMAEPEIKIGYNSWWAICSNIALFESPERIVREIFVENNIYKNAIVETIAKVKSIVESGRVYPVRCDKTSCPFAGKSECSLQSLSLAIGAKQLPPCPYDLDDPNVEWDSFKKNFENKIRKIPPLDLFWNAGKVRRLDKVKSSVVKPDGSSEQVWETVVLTGNEDLAEKKKYTFRAASQLFSFEFNEEEIFRMLPYYKFGIGSNGNKDFYWRVVCQAKEANLKFKEKELLNALQKIKPSEIVEGRKLYVDGKAVFGAFLQVWEKDPTADKDAPKVMRLQQVTNFLLERKGYIIDQLTGEKRDLFDYYHEQGKGVPVKNITLTMEARASMNAIIKQLNEECPRYVAKCMIPWQNSMANANRLFEASDQFSGGEVEEYFEILGCGENTRLKCFFFGNSYFYDGKFYKLEPTQKIVNIRGKKCWISYLDENWDEIKKNEELAKMPCPSYKYLHDDEKIKQIRDNFFHWWAYSWGYDNRFDGWLAAFWMVATVYKDEIQNRFNGFPLLYVAANMGSGKNYAARILGLLLGFVHWAVINLATSTAAGLTRKTKGKLPLLIDELKPGKKGDSLQEQFKSSFDGSSTIKASQLNQRDTCDYKADAPLFFISQAKPNVESFADRVVSCYMSEKWRTENPMLCEKAEQALFNEEDHLSGIYLSEIYSRIIFGKTEDNVKKLLNRIAKMQDFLQKNIKIKRKRTLLKYAVLIECGKLCWPDGDYPNEIFGFDDFKRNGSLTGLLGYIQGIAAIDEEKAVNPIFPFMNSVVNSFCAATNNPKPIVFVQIEKGKKYLYFSFDSAWKMYFQDKKSVNVEENIGNDMTIDNMMKHVSYVGKYVRGTNALRRLGYSQTMYKFSEGEIFDSLKGIAKLVKDGDLVPYSVYDDDEKENEDESGS